MFKYLSMQKYRLEDYPWDAESERFLFDMAYVLPFTQELTVEEGLGWHLPKPSPRVPERLPFTKAVPRALEP